MPDPAKPMSDEELAAAEARYAASTPGRWRVGHSESECAATLRVCPVRQDGESEPAVDVVIPFGRAYSDARFIAHTHDDVPRLLATVRADRAFIACVETNLDTWRQVANERCAETDRLLARCERLTEERDSAIATVRARDDRPGGDQRAIQGTRRRQHWQHWLYGAAGRG